MEPKDCKPPGATAQYCLVLIISGVSNVKKPCNQRSIQLTYHVAYMTPISRVSTARSVEVDRRGRWPPAMADYVGHLALQCTCAQALYAWGCDEVYRLQNTGRGFSDIPI